MMTPQLPKQPLDTHSTRNAIIAGIALILLGAVALLTQLLDMNDLGLFIMPVLAVIFLVWGLLAHEFGLIIPGGILAGIGVGTYLMAKGAEFGLEGNLSVAVFLLSFAAGWALISLLSLVTSERWQWWPLIPGGILAGIGVLFIAGEQGIQVLQWLSYAWPIALIIGGLYLLFRRR